MSYSQVVDVLGNVSSECQCLLLLVVFGEEGGIG